MTYANLERRTTDLEGRLADIDYGYRESMLALMRICVGSRIESARLIDHANHLGRGVELIMERLGIDGCPIGTVTSVGTAEVDEIIAAAGLRPPVPRHTRHDAAHTDSASPDNESS